MPYLNEEARGRLGDYGAESPGDLNYLVTRLVVQHVQNNGLNYQTINDISGALTEALAEFRRRIVVPYESEKMWTNGDVYQPIAERADETREDWIERVNEDGWHSR